MKLEIEGEVIGKNPSSEAIAKALSSLDGKNKSFAILERDRLTYIQASGSIKDGFSLEYQDGSLKEHYCCSDDLSLKNATEAFQSYAKGENNWQKALKWKPMKMRAKGGVHLTKPQFDFSLSALFIYALIGLCLLAVFFGLRSGANKQVWLSVFFTSAALFVATGTTQILRSGRMRGTFFTTTRSESPIQFWVQVVFGYLISLAILAVVILALTKHSG